MARAIETTEAAIVPWRLGTGYDVACKCCARAGYEGPPLMCSAEMTGLRRPTVAPRRNRDMEWRDSMPGRAVEEGYEGSREDTGLSETELNDGTADRFLLDAAGTTLLVFHSKTCANCAVARRQLPGMRLPVARLAWVDAGENGGLVERYEVFHLPAMFVVRDGVFYGAIQAHLSAVDIGRQIRLALDSYPAELP